MQMEKLFPPFITNSTDSLIKVDIFFIFQFYFIIISDIKGTQTVIFWKLFHSEMTDEQIERKKILCLSIIPIQ